MALLVAHVDNVLAPKCRVLIREAADEEPAVRRRLDEELQALERLLDRVTFFSARIRPSPTSGPGRG